MDRRNFRIIGLNALLLVREFEAVFCDMGLTGTKATSESRESYRKEFIREIDRKNKKTCLTIAEIYRSMGNPRMEREYWTEAEVYAHMSVKS